LEAPEITAARTITFVFKSLKHLFENRVLRRIFGSKSKKVVEGCTVGSFVTLHFTE
jgi:hypothetical protein